MINYQIDKSRYYLKSPYQMKPRRIVFHNSGSDASATAEIDYMERNNLELSFHDACDDTGAYNAIPHDRNAWHCGNYKNNLDHIGIEICYSKSGGERFKKAEENGVKLCAKLCALYGMNPMTDIVEHRSMFNTNCPERSDINDIRVRVKRLMNGQTVEPIPPSNLSENKITEYAESGTCTICVAEGVYFYNNPYISTVTGSYEYNDSVVYDYVVITNKYVYVSWISKYTGERRYMPVKDKINNERWGNCS